MDPIFAMLAEEVRHALEDVRLQRYREAERTLEGVLLVNQLVHLYRRGDPYARRLMSLMQRMSHEWTPEGRLEWQRRRIEWNREWAELADWERNQEQYDPRATLRAEWIREASRAYRPI